MSGDVVKSLIQHDPRTADRDPHRQEATARRVHELFYADLFMAITEMEGVQPRNEQELFFRNEEKLSQLGPGGRSRQHREARDRHRSRVHDPQEPRHAAADPARASEPTARDRVRLDPRLAQKAAMNTAIERAARFVGFLTGIFPEAALKFDAEQAVDEFAGAAGRRRGSSARTKWLRS
jgi:hypothetical protein